MLGHNYLFDRRVNGFLTKMDDSKSMVSLGLRDGVESSGRTVIAYTRDPHGGRERLIEEIATMIIWAFGINWMKNLYDWTAKNNRFMKIALPDLDASLLKQKKIPSRPHFFRFFTPPSSQHLLDKNLFHPEQFGQPAFHGVYTALEKVVKNQRLRNIYAVSNIIKFLFATGLPVAVIGFGIPSFNKWLTRKKIKEEKAKTASLFPRLGPLFHPFNQRFTSNLFPTTGNFGAPSLRILAQNQFHNAPTTHLPTDSAAKQTSAFLGYAQPAQFQPQPFHSGLNQASSPKGRQVQFGNLGEVASNLLQNERLNTFLVDLSISNFRLYEGRNWIERQEIAQREISIIFFLYFAQKWIQDGISEMLGHYSQLSFDATKYLYEKYKHNPIHFKNDYKRSLEALSQHLGPESALSQQIQAQEEQKGFKFYKNLLTNQKKLSAVQESHYKMEKNLVQAIQQYFLKNKNDNLILETAKHCGWIPTFDGPVNPSKNLAATFKAKTMNQVSNVKDTAQFLVNSKSTTAQASKAGKYLDLSKKVDVEPIWNLIKQLNGVVAHTETSNFQNVMRKAISSRASAWLLSNAVCTLFLSFLCPLAQHYLTFKLTGQNAFPGAQETKQPKQQNVKATA